MAIGIGILLMFIADTNIVEMDEGEKLKEEFGNRLEKMRKDYRKKYGK